MMSSALSPRFIPASALALLVGLCLQFLMQALISSPGKAHSPVTNAVEIASVAPPPPRPPTDSKVVKPKFPIRPPSGHGTVAIPPITPPSPAPTVPTMDGRNTIAPAFDTRTLFQNPKLPDMPARSRGPLRPTFPPEALRAGKNGRVTAAFTVDAAGQVVDIDIERVAPRGVGFENAVRRALRGAQFAPATIDGESTSSRVRQEFVFELDSLTKSK